MTNKITMKKHQNHHFATGKNVSTTIFYPYLSRTVRLIDRKKKFFPDWKEGNFTYHDVLDLCPRLCRYPQKGRTHGKPTQYWVPSILEPCQKTSKTCQNELNPHKTLLFVIAEVTADEGYLQGVDHVSRRNGSMKWTFL